MKKIIENIGKFAWGALKGGLKEIGLSENKIDSIIKELENNIEISIKNNNINNINSSICINNNSELDNKPNSENKLNYEDSEFLGNIIKRYVENEKDTLKKRILEEINSRLEILHLSGKKPEDVNLYVNELVNIHLYQKIINSNHFTKDEKKRVYDIWNPNQFALDFNYILKFLGIVFSLQ